jgi:hypothetical protein
MKKQLIFIIFAIVLASCNSVAVNTQSVSPAATSAPGTPESATQAPSSGIDPTWKTYTNEEVGFSIQYPANWQEGTIPHDNPDMHNIDLKGPEGEVELEWGTGFGGACPDGYQPIAVAKGTLPACHFQREDGTETWSLTGKPFANTSFSGFAQTNDTTAESREVILKMISTLSFP